MDLKLKKLLLLTMQINNANQLTIKASPNKIINIQLFANVFNQYLFINNCKYYLKQLLSKNNFMILGHDDVVQYGLCPTKINE